MSGPRLVDVASDLLAIVSHTLFWPVHRVIDARKKARFEAAAREAFTDARVEGDVIHAGDHAIPFDAIERVVWMEQGSLSFTPESRCLYQLEVAGKGCVAFVGWHDDASNREVHRALAARGLLQAPPIDGGMSWGPAGCVHAFGFVLWMALIAAVVLALR